MRIRHSRLAWVAGVIFALIMMAVFTLPAKRLLVSFHEAAGFGH